MRSAPTLAVFALSCILLAGCSPVPGAAPAAAPAEAAERLVGDEELLDTVRHQFLEENDRVAVAVVHGDDVRFAFVNADDGTIFEIGSVTKTMTGELLAQAIERGEVALADPVGRYLDLGASPVASVTFEQLATHRSGLSTFPDDPEWQAPVLEAYEAGTDAFDESVDEMVALAAAMELSPQNGYSNIGAALVGQAIAAAAGTTYSTLAVDRIFEPAGMGTAIVVETPGQVPDAHAGGFSDAGESVEPSTLAAFSPAGGVQASIEDMVAYARAVIDGPLADSAAQHVLATDEHDRGSGIGYFWGITTRGPQTILSHGGMTSGFASTLYVDRAAGTAAIVLSNRSDANVDDLGLRLLALAG